MAGTETKRIIELTEASTVQSGDFIAVDSNARGTKKVPTDTLATSAALTAETNARAGADEQMSERMDGIEEQTALIQNPTKTLSGALCSFTDGADMPMVACRAEIVPKQAGTGTPSPDNVRPISGWESVNVGVSGINQFDGEMENGYWDTSTGDFVVAGNWQGCKNYIPIDASKTYFMYGDASVTGSYGAMLFYDKNKNYLGSQNGAKNTTFTPTANACYMTFYISNNYIGKEVGINYPSTFTAYEPYTGTTTPVNFGRTVYGGEAEIVGGILTDKMVIYDIGNWSWTLAGGVFRATLPVPAHGSGNNNVKLDNFICSHYPTECWNASTDKTIRISGDGKLCSVKDTTYTSVADFKSAMSGVQLVYELATPQTYTLTPTEVSTLLGENNVWADSGDVEITYRRDISIVINNLESALNGSNSLNTMMMSAPTENTAEEPTEDEAEDDMR